MFAAVASSIKAGIDHLLAQRRSPWTEVWNTIEHIDDQMKTVEVIQHHHVEWGGGGALLPVPVDMEVLVVRSLVRQTVNKGWIAVVGEDHRAVEGEEGIELTVGQAMGVFRVRF